MVESHHHRSTLKQQNKSFKSKYASKSAIKRTAKGKTNRASPKSHPNTPSAAQARQNRRNHAKQAQLQKRQSLVASTRIFNGVDGAPRIVAVVPLSPDVKPSDVSKGLAEALSLSSEECPETGVWKIKADRFKTSLQIINLPYRSLYSTLDAVKAADYVLFVLSPTTEVDAWGDTLLRALQAQGLPTVVSVVAPNPSLDAKSRPTILKSLLSFMQYFVPSQTRVYDMHSSADRMNALRALCEGKPDEVRWREGRAWMLGEGVVFEEKGEAKGTLKVTGVVRGAALSANRLVHLPGRGDYQVERITSFPLPRHLRGNDAGMDIEPTTLAEPDADEADSLVSSNDPDDLANEQTWPTEEEMNGHGPGQNGNDIPDAKEGTTPRKVKRVPKGWSDYQAAWIVDDEDDENNEGSESEEDGEEMRDVEIGAEREVMVEGEDEMESVTHRSVAFEDMDMADEEEQLQKWRSRTREDEEKDDMQFPDEIDTPLDIPARTRFQRYRGLRSFRTSPWDPYENLPKDYARIFQFEDYKRTERSVRRRAEEDVAVVQPGVRVTVHLKDVPLEAAIVAAGTPFVMFGLWQHEHKMTVLNFTVQRNTEYDGSVRSKDPLILCVGPRRLHTRPVYSQHTQGGGKGYNNVHKFERYLRHGDMYVATTYGPVVFGKQSCMLLRETKDLEAPNLVAMGTFFNPDTTRIIAKRIVLTGHPFKIHKKTATVRYMFFNPDDVRYFAPIQLHTKYGRAGHIRESLGTHGYFKAHFDGPVNQMDTVCMSLYKRVYPRWCEPWTCKGNVQSQVDGDAMEE
ncbi:ribosome biogenesis protein tsr1 [Neolentinus lepideus HHB14362 ss-1]|uniref:Ribosome biogenesis protein tsr1 n=1 Tax=Neolentinus lepideus HHB14362 ss-1 TaxID=1314782 RepID=A0A165V3H9_9AGAM|nr:ribosome biogenesis protein tsr1 [Neolentinus lepideus HHB14362 ss-1]